MGRSERVLFLCTHNTACSQMAEAMLHHVGGATFEATAAGPPSATVPPLVVRAMEDVGIDMLGATARSVQELLNRSFGYVTTLCAAATETCRAFPGAVRLHRSFDDLSAASESERERLEAFRSVRDGLGERVRQRLLRTED